MPDGYYLKPRTADELRDRLAQGPGYPVPERIIGPGLVVGLVKCTSTSANFAIDGQPLYPAVRVVPSSEVGIPPSAGNVWLTVIGDNGASCAPILNRTYLAIFTGNRTDSGQTLPRAIAVDPLSPFTARITSKSAGSLDFVAVKMDAGGAWVDQSGPAGTAKVVPLEGSASYTVSPNVTHAIVWPGPSPGRWECIPWQAANANGTSGVSTFWPGLISIGTQIFSGLKRFVNGIEILIGSSILTQNGHIHANGTGITLSTTSSGSGNVSLNCGAVASSGGVSATGYTASGASGITGTRNMMGADGFSKTVTITGGIITGWST